MPSKYEMAIAVKAAPGVMGALGRLAFGLSIYTFMTGLHNIAEMRLNQTRNRAIDLQLKQAELLEKRVKIEQEYAEASANVQMLEGRRAALQEGITRAIASGTATSIDYQIAQTLLIQTERDLERARKDQQKALEDRIQNERQLEKLGRQIELQEQAIALAQQQVTNTGFTVALAQVQIGLSLGQVIFQVGKVLFAYQVYRAEMVLLNTEIIKNIALTDASTAKQLAHGFAVNQVAASYRNLAVSAALGVGIVGVLFGAIFAFAAWQIEQEKRAGRVRPTAEILYGPAATRMQGVEEGGWMQYGGLVTRPTMAMLGEKGPEMVTPLGGGRGAVNVSIYAGGIIGGNLAELERFITEIMERYLDRHIRGIQ